MGLLCLVLLCLPLPAHPVDEYFLRYEVQVMLLTRGLRLDIFVLHGGLAAMPSWRAHDQDQDMLLTPEEQQAWAQALVNQVAVTLDGRPAALAVEYAQFPDHADFTSCTESIVLRAGVQAVPPPARPIRCRVAVRPDPGYPVLARVSFVAPSSVQMSPPEAATAAAETTVIWPQDGEPDTRLPQLTVPAWFYERPEDLGLTPLAPSAPTDRSPVAWAPAATLQGGSRWPAVALVIVALAAALAVAKRGRIVRR